MSQLPNFLIVGAQKSGTTWLHSCLRKSAHVYASQPKELNFFNQPRFTDKLEDYRKHFPYKEGARYYLESTPHYFQMPRADRDIAARIADTLDDPKILVILRNPVERYESAYIHHMMQGRLPFISEIDDVSDNHLMLALGYYSDILAHWQQTFGNMGVFLYDDLVEDRVAFMERVFDFLELQSDLSREDIEFRTNDKMLKVRKLDDPWDRLPELTTRARQELAGIYREDVMRLASQINRDLSYWLEPAQS